MRFAVIGCGIIGKTHAETIKSLSPDAELVAVVDVDNDRAEQFAASYGVDSSTSIADTVARADVDAVAICTPSGQHADIAVAALEHGKNVVIEKPIDITLDAARRIGDAEANSTGKVAVISQHRFDEASQVVHQALQAGKFGRLTSGVASMAWWRSQEYYDSAGWRGTWEFDGGGALMNQGIHTIDLLLWYLGTPVDVVAFSECLAHERIEVEDTAVAALRFESGALGVIHGTTAAYPGLSTRVQVHGDRGSAIIDGDKLVTLRTDSDEADGDVTAERPAFGDAHALQYRDFLDAVAKDRPPLVGVPEGTLAIAVIHAVYESARTGKTVKL